jgi:hypothetical protein
MNATPPAVRAHAPLTPQGAPALQRTVGNQAAIVVSRMPQPQQQQQQEAPQQGGGDTGGYLHGWLVWFFAWFAWFTRNAQRQAPVAVEAAPVAEPTPPPVAAPKAAAEEAPPPTTAPMVTAKEQPVISEYEHVELRTKFRKLSSTRDEMNAKLQTRLDELSEEIEPLLKQGAVVRVDKLEKVEHEIKNIYRAMEKAPASQPRAGESSTEPAVTNAEGQRPVEIEIRYGTKIGSNAEGWGPYGDVVEQVIKDMRDGRVTLGPDFKPKLGLAVKGHWQQGDPQNFIKVYLDSKDRGGGTQMRAYFRYKVVGDRLVIKFVAIREEHAGKDTTRFGDHTEVVSETES